MVMDLVALVARVEAHVGWVGPVRLRREPADLAETDDLRPEAVRFLNLADVQHQMIDAARSDWLVHCIPPDICPSPALLRGLYEGWPECARGGFQLLPEEPIEK